MQYLCNKHGLTRFYPTDPGERAMVDSAMFYLIGTMYPVVARATYRCSNFPQYAGEVGSSDADAETKARAQAAAEAAVARPLEVYRAFFLDGKTFIGGDTPSIADIRLAATIEFLRAIDYDLPGGPSRISPPWSRRSEMRTRNPRRTCAATSRASRRLRPLNTAHAAARQGKDPGKAGSFLWRRRCGKTVPPRV